MHMRLDFLTIMSFIWLGNASTCGPVKIDKQSFTTKLSVGHLHLLNTFPHQMPSCTGKGPSVSAGGKFSY